MTNRTQKAKYKYQSGGAWEKSLLRECHYCGVMMTKQQSTVEHVVPQSKSKRKSRDTRNMRLACKPCNSQRGNKEYETFKLLKLAEKQVRRAARQAKA